MSNSEIVKYHNDFNKIQLPSFTEQEQNLLCGLMIKLKEQKQSVEFLPQDLREILRSDCNNISLANFCKSLRSKFFSANFTILIKEQNSYVDRTINLFSMMEIYYMDDKKTKLEKLVIEVNPKFEYLLNKLTANFTAFELAEFVALSGKYTKTLYRLLKQFRSTGKMAMEWEEFKRVMDIPEKLHMRDIDKRILKPAVKELSAQRNLFDQVRVPFQNLSYEKEKVKARGRGGRVVGIIFTFKPENVVLQKNEKMLKLSNSQKINKALENLISQKWLYEDELLQIVRIENSSVFCNILERDDYENLVFAGTREVIFKDVEQMINEVSKRVC